MRAMVNIKGNYSRIVNTKSRRFILGIVLAIVSMASTYLIIGQIKAGIFFAVCFFIAGWFDLSEKMMSWKQTAVLFLLWFLLAAYLTCFLSQYVLDSSFKSIGIEKMLLNIGICIVFFLILFIITLKPVLSVSIITGLFVLISVANFYVYSFRGSELQPLDFFSIQTAWNVAGNYNIALNKPVFYGIIFTCVFILGSFGLPKIEFKKKLPVKLLSLLTICLITVIEIFCCKSIKTGNFQQYGSFGNGYILNFMLHFRESFVNKPDGYDLASIDNLANKYFKDISNTNHDKTDIIVIMDESFANLSVLGSELRTSQEVTPFIDSLTKNTIRGYALSSVYGGETPNSEYEFLSGNTMMFLPNGSIAYQQFISDPTYSMVGELKKNGYKCVAMHPYLASGWSRLTVYPKLGFDESLFLEDFPTEKLVRGYVSDQAMFEKLIDYYNDSKASFQNVFIFGVTMQNHGGYDYNGDNYKKTITLEGYSHDYDDAEQYLSLIHNTDSAVKYLIEYFSNVDDHVMIVFFGDHLPKLNDDFYEELHGGPFVTIDEQQLKYMVPFFIWTNYDSDENEVELTSLNYLSNYVYKKAGLELPVYNKYLSDIQNSIPGMNINGYYSLSEGKFLKYSDSRNEERDILNQYNQIEYNSIFDKKNRNRVFFPIEK